MASISEKKEVEKWSSRIDVAKRVKAEKWDDRAKTWMDYYENKPFGKKEAYDRIAVGYTFSIIKSIIPQIYYQDPYIFVTADKMKYGTNQWLVEEVINYYWRSMGMKQQMKRIILDALVLGFGIGKLGYHTDYEKKKNNSQLETNAEYLYEVKDEYPYFLRQSPMDVVFDTEAKSLADIRWLAVRYAVPLDRVKNTDIYKHTSELEGKYKDLDDKDKSGSERKAIEEDVKKTLIWEIHDLVDDKVAAKADELSDKWLRPMEDNPYGCNNFKFLYFNEKPEDIFPVSDVEMLAPLNKEYNETVTQLLNHRKKSQRKIVAEEGLFVSDEDEDNFMDEDDMKLAMVHADGIDKIKIFDPSMVQAELYNVLNRILFDMNNVMRNGFNQRAVESPTEKTATEASIIEKNANIGNSERLDIVTDYSEMLARDLLKVLQKFSSKKKEFFAKNIGGYVNFTKEDIAGDYNVKMEIGSTVKRNSDVDRNRASQFFQMTAGVQFMNPYTQQPTTLINLHEAGKILAEKFGFTESEITRMIPELTPPQPQPNPLGEGGEIEGSGQEM